MEFDREKFKKLVVYVASRTGSTPGFGATKLNKVLWFADARAYSLRGKPVTGATYIREKFGPVPKAIMPIRKELEAARQIRVRKERYFDSEITRYEALVPADTSVFDKDELQDIDYWIKHIATEHTAQSISEETHDYAWEIAQMGEVIPYYAIFANRIRPSDGEELDWAREEAKRLELI